MDDDDDDDEHHVASPHTCLFILYPKISLSITVTPEGLSQGSCPDVEPHCPIALRDNVDVMGRKKKMISNCNYWEDKKQAFFFSPTYGQSHF